MPAEHNRRPHSYRISHLGRGKARDYDRDFWNESTAKGLNWQLERRLLDLIFAEALPRPPSRALDFACGTGRVLAELEHRVPETIGVDISDDMLEVARHRCPRSRLISGDVSAGAVDVGGPVELVTTFRFLLNAEPSLRAAALRWIRGALTADGHLVANFHLNPRSLRGRYLRLRWRGQQHQPMLTSTQAERLLSDAGFEVVARYGYEFLPYRRDGGQLILPRLRQRVEQGLLGRRRLLRAAGTFVLVARVR